jgi:hypothetical protein
MYPNGIAFSQFAPRDPSLPSKPTMTEFGESQNPFPSDPLQNFSLPTVNPTYVAPTNTTFDMNVAKQTIQSEYSWLVIVFVYYAST